MPGRLSTTPVARRSLRDVHFFAGRERDAEVAGPALRGNDLAGSKLHGGVLSQLLARQAQEFARRRAVAREEAVQRVRRGVAVPAVIEDQHRAPAPAEHQGSAQSGGAGADDDDVSAVDVNSQLQLTARTAGARRTSCCDFTPCSNDSRGSWSWSCARRLRARSPRSAVAAQTPGRDHGARARRSAPAGVRRRAGATRRRGRHHR